MTSYATRFRCAGLKSRLCTKRRIPRATRTSRLLGTVALRVGSRVAPDVLAVHGTTSKWTRWDQLLLGIIRLVMVANLQYGWILFIDPTDAM
jgi:hypothetical protein